MPRRGHSLYTAERIKQNNSLKIMTYCYRVYGLRVHSELEFPELCPDASTGASDVEIRLGDVPEGLSAPIRRFERVEHSHDACLLRVEGVARYLIEQGARITIDCSAAQSDRRGEGPRAADVRLFALGSAFGALLHQRALVPLHVSAVTVGDRLWAFTGPTGAGKSTLAAWLSMRLGTPVFSDDVAVLAPGRSSAELHAGPRKLKLWDDAVELLGCQGVRLVRDLSNTAKFQLYLEPAQTIEAMPLSALVVLDQAEPGEAATLDKVRGIKKFRACRRSVYRPHMAAWFRDRHDYINDLLALAQCIEVWRFRRHWSLSDIESQAEPLLDAMAAMSTPAASAL